ncbi:MAG: rhomboid family protein [Thermoanaerobaculia bacterium]|nr:rhomboid family protein [Thermoanaerobaculia bacterium]
MSAPLVLPCFRHPEREAAARCPACRRAFCRECVTEHDGRVLCASCLRAAASPAAPPRRRIAARFAAAAGFLAAWLFFFLLGRLLVALPSSAGEGAGFGDPPTRSEPR